jgi:fatty acid desaturase
MQSASLSSSSSRSGPSISTYEALFFAALFLFVVVVCTWPVLAWRIHHFSTWVPDAEHTYAVHERGATFYLSSMLGRFYVSLPWLWGSLLGATILTGFLTGKSTGGSK